MTILVLPATSFLFAGIVTALFPGRLPDEGDVRHRYPPIQLAIGLSGHSYILPHLLGYLENLDYPKSRIHLELYLNSKEDSTADQIMWWKDSVSSLFSSVKIIVNSDNWLEAGLRAARLRKVGRLLLMSGDTLPQQSRFIQQLNSSQIVIIPLFNAPMGRKETNVRDIGGDFMTRSNRREKITSAALPLFIALDSIDSSYLTFEADNLSFYEGAGDPLEVFTQSAKRMNIDLWVDYQNSHGLYINETLEREERRKLYRYALADMIADGFSLPLHSRSVRPWTPDPNLWGVKKVYLINLNRRSERLARMDKIFKILGVDYTRWEATDGKTLSLYSNYSYKVLPGYLDPFHKRPMKAGEIGCFLSHYRIWKNVVQNGLDRVIVFEDDLRFSEGGLERILEVLEDLDSSKMDWDLIYLGRKKQADQEELWVPYHRHLSTVGYSYWTLGYLLSYSGAKKLVDGKPLEKMIPVDEYLPVMFDKHPNKEWLSHYAVRDLRAFTLYPLVVSPQRYTSDQDYVSDTEDSPIVIDTNGNNEDAEKSKSVRRSEL